MSCLVSGLSTCRTIGLADHFLREAMGSRADSWALAFPSVLVIAPISRRMVARAVQQP